MNSQSRDENNKFKNEVWTILYFLSQNMKSFSIKPPKSFITSSLWSKHLLSLDEANWVKGQRKVYEKTYLQDVESIGSSSFKAESGIEEFLIDTQDSNMSSSPCSILYMHI